MSRDQSGRFKWSREQAQNSNAIDRFLCGANSLVISVVELDKNHDTAMLPITFLWEKAHRLLRFLRMEIDHLNYRETN